MLRIDAVSKISLEIAHVPAAFKSPYLRPLLNSINLYQFYIWWFFEKVPSFDKTSFLPLSVYLFTLKRSMKIRWSCPYTDVIFMCLTYHSHTGKMFWTKISTLRYSFTLGSIDKLKLWKNNTSLWPLTVLAKRWNSRNLDDFFHIHVSQN